MLPRASLPTCPACLHTGFLLLQRIPSLPLPPDLLDLLPSIPHYAPHVPPAAILASLPLIADWLQQFPTPVHPTAFRTTPPLLVGSSWTSFWSLDYATDWTTASSAPPPPPFYWRHPSAGGPWALGLDLPEVPTVCSTPCATCGRPTPHEAPVDHPSSSPTSSPASSACTPGGTHPSAPVPWPPAAPYRFWSRAWTALFLYMSSLGPPSAPRYYRSSCSLPHRTCERSPRQPHQLPSLISPPPSRS